MGTDTIFVLIANEQQYDHLRKLAAQGELWSGGPPERFFDMEREEGQDTEDFVLSHDHEIKGFQSDGMPPYLHVTYNRLLVESPMGAQLPLTWISISTGDRYYYGSGASARILAMNFFSGLARHNSEFRGCDLSRWPEQPGLCPSEEEWINQAWLDFVEFLKWKTLLLPLLKNALCVPTALVHLVQDYAPSPDIQSHHEQLLVRGRILE